MDACMIVTADLARGGAAYARDTAEDLSESARALRAKAQVLRRHINELQAASLALQAESDHLLQRLKHDRRVRNRAFDEA